MVEVALVMQAIEDALTAARPDGRYALEDTGFAPTIMVSPDSGDELAPRDLLVAPHLGGPVCNGDQYLYPLTILLVAANYSGDRTSYLSGQALTARERCHGFADHVLSILEETPIPGGEITALGYDAPRASRPPDWLETVVSCTLTLAR